MLVQEGGVMSSSWQEGAIKVSPEARCYNFQLHFDDEEQ